MTLPYFRKVLRAEGGERLRHHQSVTVHEEVLHLPDLQPEYNHKETSEETGPDRKALQSNQAKNRAVPEPVSKVLGLFGQGL